MKVLPLYDRNDNLLDYALVDDDDFERAEQHTWRLESYKRKDREPRQYAYARIDKIRTRLHHFVMGWPPEDEDVIDHRDFDGLHNRKVNLRVASGRQNAQNALKPWDSASAYIGVSTNDEYWYAYCGGVYIGQYKTEEDAAIAHDQAAIVAYGPDALTNGLESEPPPARVSCRLDRDLPTGVTRTNAKARPFVAQCNKRYIGAYATADAAQAAYVKAKLNDEAQRRQAIFALPIDRNEDDVAIITIYNKDGTPKRDIFCDDHTWHTLMMHRWYDAGGYCAATIDQVSIKMHCFLMKSTWIDHRDGNKDDNRHRNLRKTTRSGNSQNVRRTSDDVPEYQGVYTSRAGNRYEAAITCNGHQYYLGSYQTKEAAALAYNRRALELYSEPKLNDVDEAKVDMSDNGIKVRPGTSRFRGVSGRPGKWTAHVQKDKIPYASHGWLSEEEGALAYNFLARKHHDNSKLNTVSLAEAKLARSKAIDTYLQDRGVRPQRKKFSARIEKNKVTYSLGSFATRAEAITAYRMKWFELYYDEYDTHLEGWSLERDIAASA